MRVMYAPGKWADMGPAVGYRPHLVRSGEPVARVAAVPEHAHTPKQGRCVRCGRLKEGTEL